MALFNRFRKRQDSVGQQAPQGNTGTAIPDASPTEDESLRGEVTRLYERGVDPLLAIRAMLYDKDRNLITDAKRLAGIWLGINDLLDRDDVVNPLRSELVSLRDVLGESIAVTGDGPSGLSRS